MRNKFLSHEYRVLSSAKLHISDFSIKKNISFVNIFNSSGPNIDRLRNRTKNLRPITISGSHFSSLFSAAQEIKKNNLRPFVQGYMLLILLLLNHAVSSHKL